MATCPECEFDEIDTEDYEDGDTLSCPECGRNLVMVGADEVDLADDEDEEDEPEEDDDGGADFDDDDEDDDDEDRDEEDEDYE
jgi:hypothetical protein